MTDFFIPKKPTKDLWYKEPWMLLVLGGPAIVVIAASATFFIAWHGADKVVSKDYYKQAQNIDKDIHRDARAYEYNMQATANIDNNSGRLQLQLKGNTQTPSALIFSISAALSTSTEETTKKIILSQVKPGQYEGVITDLIDAGFLTNKLWHIKIEADDWRLTADWFNPTHSALQIKTSK
jgi:hypothetical protein